MKRSRGDVALVALMALVALAGCGTTQAPARGDSGQADGAASPVEPARAADATGERAPAPDVAAQRPPAADAGDTPPPASGAATPEPCDNGVRQIYPAARGRAAPWTLGFGEWRARARQFGTISGEGAATEVAGSGQVRMTIAATPSACEGDVDQGRALQRGFMCGPSDWTNWEMTGYVRLVEPAGSAADQDFTWYGNGGRHTGDGPPTGCLGSSYKASYHYKEARVRFGKESWHVNYHYKPWKAVPGAVDLTVERTRWLGMKLVRYEIARNGKKGVRLELWLDLAGLGPDGSPANDWKLVDVAEDHPDAPSWGRQARMCGVPADDQIMSWGGPWITFRWDNTSARLKLMCLREIAPPAVAPPAP